MTQAFDVVVLGLGPAGARAARAAAARGCRVVAFDRKRVAGQPVQCAELVPGLIGQDGVVLGPALIQSVRRMVTMVEDTEPHITAPFPGYMINRAEFDRALVESARSAGADCRLASVVRSVDARSGTVVVGSERIHARVLIGADGPRSRLGRALGRCNRALVHARQITVRQPAPRDATDIFLSRDIPGGYGWLFPKGACAHVGVGVSAAARHRLGTLLDALHRRLLAAGRVGAEVLSMTGGLIPVGGRVPAARVRDGGLCLLAGDAAGLTNPVTGAGIHAALVSGELAGVAAADWLDGQAAAGADYEAELDALFDSTLARALARRYALLQQAAARPPTVDEQRTAWVAYPAYWTPAPANEEHHDEVCV
ncbi:MAG: NAD(P)/FAD-dependent oxidoreductase [Gammaproteobacteria bacterium]